MLLSSHLSTKLMVRFLNLMTVSLKAGIPIVRALRLAENNSQTIGKLVQSICFYLEQGATLEEAMRQQRRFLPDFVIEVIAAGERSGQLVSVFAALTDYYEERLRLQRALWRQLTYPLCVIVAAVVIIPFVKQFVIANINEHTISICEYTLQYLIGWASPVFYVIVFILLARFGAFRPLTNILTLDLPFVAAYTRRIALARFLWTFSVLVDSTVPIHEAIVRAARATGNKRLERDLLPAVQEVKNGNTLGVAFVNSRYLSVMMRQMIDVGETSGNLPQTLEKAAEYTINEAHHLVSMAIRLVEIILIIWIGFFLVMP